MPKTYKLATLEDLLQVPADRREACMREVLYAMSLHDLVIDADWQRDFYSMTWTDDDEMRINMRFGESEQTLTLHVTPSEEDAISRRKRILEMVDTYTNRPDQMNRTALLVALMGEFEDAYAQGREGFRTSTSEP